MSTKPITIETYKRKEQKTHELRQLKLKPQTRHPVGKKIHYKGTKHTQIHKTINKRYKKKRHKCIQDRENYIYFKSLKLHAVNPFSINKKSVFKIKYRLNENTNWHWRIKKSLFRH